MISCFRKRSRLVPQTGRFATSSSRQFHAIPTIDLNLAKESSQERQALLDACTQVGVFYVKTPSREFDELGRAFLGEAGTFFSRPDEEKEQGLFNDSPHWRGFAPFGNEVTAGRADLREQIDLSFPEHESTFPARPGDAPFNVIRGPNQWPASGCGGKLKEVSISSSPLIHLLSSVLSSHDTPPRQPLHPPQNAERYYKSTVSDVSDVMCEAMALALGLDSTAFDHIRGGRWAALSLSSSHIHTHTHPLTLSVSVSLYLAST